MYALVQQPLGGVASRVDSLARAGRWAEALQMAAPLRATAEGRALVARLGVNAGLAAYRGDRKADARRLWEQALADDSLLVEAAVDLGALLLETGDRAGARAVATRASRRHPHDERLLALRIQAAELGDIAGVAALLDTLARGPGASEALTRSASAALLAAERPAEAQELASHGLARWPRSGGLLVELARARAATGDTVAALDALRTLRALPGPRVTLLAAARDAPALGAVALADSLYADLLAHDPSDGAALEGALAVAERLGDTARAGALALRAAALDSSGPEPLLALLRLAHPPADSARRLLRAALWRGVEALQGVEMMLAGASGHLQAEPSPDAAQRRHALASLVRATVDTVVFHTAWGPGELEPLQQAFPGSPLLERVAADLAARQGRDSLALARYDALLARQPADPELHAARAAVAERNGRRAEAVAGYERSLELDPAGPAFRALVRLRQADGTLEVLLAQVRRLRLALPDQPDLAHYEIEVLQRLGRLEEAAALRSARDEARP
jgi:tetratricopeptide (TPR) repeat protein